MFELDDDKWTYATKTIKYEALMELYFYDTQTRKKDKHGEPALDDMTIPAMKKHYYRVLAHGEPADNAREPANESNYDESFGVDFLRYYKTRKERKANNLVAAARNKNDKVFAQTQANDETMNEEKVAFAPTRATNDRKDEESLQQSDKKAMATREASETKPMAAGSAAATTA